jgi:broad specificity phosphatase PhoE
MTTLAPPSPPMRNVSTGTAGNSLGEMESLGTSKKVIYFVRHAEAEHNVKERQAVAAAKSAGETRKEELEKARKAVLAEDASLKDAPLSQDGIDQVRNSGRRLNKLFASMKPAPFGGGSSPSRQNRSRSRSGSVDPGSVFKKPDVVLVSPLRRALMTATELFLHADGDGADPPPRFLAIEALREKRTGYLADERSSVEELRKEFPHVDFSDVEAQTVVVPSGEGNSEVRSRGAKYLDETLPYVEGTHLAIVSHKGWLRELRHTLKSRVDTGHLRADFDLEDWEKTLYGNAEVRVASFRWQDGELTSVVSRSVDNALVLANAAGMLGDGFEFALGPPQSGFSIFLAERTTKVHFISVSEGEHNVAVRRIARDHAEFSGDHKAAALEAEATLLRQDGMATRHHDLHDARLTAKGRKEAKTLKEILSNRPSGGRPFTAFNLVVVSPLTRACETADIVFGQTPGKYGGEEVPPPRILVREECRERYGKYVCDSRRSGAELETDFPGFDFSELESNEDEWHTDERESPLAIQDRAIEFLQWLSSRPERCVAVVTHHEFLRHLFGQFGDTLHEEDRSLLQRTAANCQLRSVVLCSHGPTGTENDGPRSTIRVPSVSSVGSLASIRSNDEG